LEASSGTGFRDILISFQLHKSDYGKMNFKFRKARLIRDIASSDGLITSERTFRLGNLARSTSHPELDLRIDATFQLRHHTLCKLRSRTVVNPYRPHSGNYTCSMARTKQPSPIRRAPSETFKQANGTSHKLHDVIESVENEVEKAAELHARDPVEQRKGGPFALLICVGGIYASL
jgi:hypothetical protein